jgi:predicted nucleic acid-binding Zn finger protein
LVVSEGRMEFVSRFAHYSRYRGIFSKAIGAVLDGCVKKHVFKPSNRTLYTVVGRSGDEFVDPQSPFCSCQHFFYRVLGGREEICYHLLSYRIASESGYLDEVDFHDEEFSSFLRLLAHDMLNQHWDKEDKESKARFSLRPR